MPSFPAAGSPAGQLTVRHGPHPYTGRSSRTSGPAWCRPHKPATPSGASRRASRPFRGEWSLLGAASSAADHHDRAAAVGDAVLADRAEEHARELTVAMTPDDDEISGRREGLEHRRWMSLDDSSPDLNRITRGEDGADGLVELPSRLLSRVVVGRHGS